MATKIDYNLIKRLFSYDKDSGELTLKEKIHNKDTRCTGIKIGRIDTGGTATCKKQYYRTVVNQRQLYVHRIIWVWMTGEQPKTIDHIDGNGLNNKWSNLRSVPHSVNGKNQKKHITNTSGITGVSYRKDSDKWRARIMVDDKMINLGTFKEKTDAIEARRLAEIKYGFTIGE